MKPERLRALRPETVKQLAESMKASGLLQPIVLRPKAGAGNGYWLVAGRHRFEAAKKLKWDSIRAAIYDGMDVDQAELAEIDENLVRADLSPAERALHIDARKTLYEKIHPETKHGAVGRGGKKRSQNEIFNDEPADAFIDDTAKKTGKSRATISRDARRGREGRDWLRDVAGTALDEKSELEALVNLSSAERNQLIDRAKVGEKVSAKTRIKQLRRNDREQELGAKIVSLPDKKYGVILVDPEWKDEVWSEETGMDRHASNHYPTSDAEVIASRDVSSIAAKDCVLWMWTTNQHLRVALGVMEAWGFEYKSNYCWGKEHISTGRWNRSKHELLLIGTRGSIPCPAPGTQWDSLIMAPRGKHSEKPECFLEMIETYFPNIPKIELNRRGPARPGWDAWGNEAEEAA
jgi:N6-adenosine-specific RNA methylase IME4/ParB-like chromosome segregation protein Spo0J